LHISTPGPVQDLGQDLHARTSPKLSQDRHRRSIKICTAPKDSKSFIWHALSDEKVARAISDLHRAARRLQKSTSKDSLNVTVPECGTC
jgi:hypothetical protein